MTQKILFWFLVVLMFIVSCFSAAAFQSAPFGGMHYWDMTNTSFLDRWTGTLNGTNTGVSIASATPATFNTTGNGGGYAVFETTDMVSLGDGVVPEQLSLSYWAYFTIFDVDDGRNTERWITIGWNSNNAGWISNNDVNGVNVHRSVYSTGGVNLQANPTFLPNTGAWYHIVWTYNNTGNWTLYVNGTEFGRGAGGDGSLADDGTAWLFSQNPNYFEGWLDEVQVFNYSINKTEVANLFNYNQIGSSGGSGYSQFRTAVDFDNNVLEGEISDFLLNVTFNHSTYSNIGATLIYNSTEYILTGVNGSINNTAFTRSVAAPEVSIPARLVRFWWNVSFYNGSSGVNGSLIVGNNTHSVYNINITNCSTGNVAYNFLIRREDNLDELAAASVGMSWSLIKGVVNQSYGFNFTDVSNMSICVNPSWANFTANAYINYEVQGGYTHRYYLVDAVVDNVVNTIYLYNWNFTNTTETLKVITLDEEYDYYPNVYMKLLRYYPASQVWRVVQMDLSDDFGQGFFHIVEESVDYKLQFEQNNTILRTTNSMKFKCPIATDCELSFLVYTLTEEDTEFSMYNWSWNNVTKVFTLNYDDTTGETDSMQLVVTRETMTGSVEICNTTLVTASGSISCNITGQVGQVWARAYRTASPSILIMSINQEVSQQILKNILAAEGFKLDGLFLSGVMVMVIMMASATSALGVIIAGILALIIVYLMKMTTIITLGFIVVAVVVALLLSVKIKK